MTVTKILVCSHWSVSAVYNMKIKNRNSMHLATKKTTEITIGLLWWALRKDNFAVFYAVFLRSALRSVLRNVFT